MVTIIGKLLIMSWVGKEVVDEHLHKVDGSYKMMARSGKKIIIRYNKKSPPPVTRPTLGRLTIVTPHSSTDVEIEAGTDMITNVDAASTNAQ